MALPRRRTTLSASPANSILNLIAMSVALGFAIFTIGPGSTSLSSVLHVLAGSGEESSDLIGPGPGSGDAGATRGPTGESPQSDPAGSAVPTLPREPIRSHGVIGIDFLPVMAAGSGDPGPDPLSRVLRLAADRLAAAADEAGHTARRRALRP